MMCPHPYETKIRGMGLCPHHHGKRARKPDKKPRVVCPEERAEESMQELAEEKEGPGKKNRNRLGSRSNASTPRNGHGAKERGKVLKKGSRPRKEGMKTTKLG